MKHRKILKLSQSKCTFLIELHAMLQLVVSRYVSNPNLIRITFKDDFCNMFAVRHEISIINASMILIAFYSTYGTVERFPIKFFQYLALYCKNV